MCRLRGRYVAVECRSCGDGMGNLARGTCGRGFGLVERRGLQSAVSAFGDVDEVDGVGESASSILKVVGCY